jgi:PilZ domain
MPKSYIHPIDESNEEDIYHGKPLARKRGERVKVDIPVRVSADAFVGADGCMKNLSLSGALMKANVDLGLHSLIEVSIKMPSPWQRTEPVTAYVSRRTKESVGVKWCEFAPTIIKDLLRSPSIPLPN